MTFPHSCPECGGSSREWLAFCSGCEPLYAAATVTPDRVATPGLSQSTQAMPLLSGDYDRATGSDA